jgi:hypothetical protein
MIQGGADVGFADLRSVRPKPLRILDGTIDESAPLRAGSEAASGLATHFPVEDAALPSTVLVSIETDR